MWKVVRFTGHAGEVPPLLFDSRRHLLPPLGRNLTHNPHSNLPLSLERGGGGVSCFAYWEGVPLPTNPNTAAPVKLSSRGATRRGDLRRCREVAPNAS